ncbi:serine hydrolase domain-containing protein [Agromyces sp. NPDC004153]
MDAAADFTTRLDRHLERVTRRRGILGAPQVAVSAPRLGIDYRSGGGSQRFHVASIGKTFTATLVMQLVEAGAFTVETPVSALLTRDELDGLFDTTGSTDAAGGATVAHLLTHTAGVADYFDGRVTTGRPVRDLVITEPERIWTPADLLAFSRTRQRPVGRPGERFAYSDTGFILLGRLLEQTTGRMFHELLHERILTPLAMRDSALLFHSVPANERASAPAAEAAPAALEGAPAPGAATAAPAAEPSTGTSLGIAPLRLGRTEASTFRSLSCDWSGGGIVSTPDDLVAFDAALHRGELVSRRSLAWLAEPRNRFHVGIRYAAGMMQVRFGGFSPFLRGLPRPVGHIGVLATHLFHDPVHDAGIVLNFASTREMSRSFRTLITIEQELARAAARA